MRFEVDRVQGRSFDSAHYVLLFRMTYRPPAIVRDSSTQQQAALVGMTAIVEDMENTIQL